MRQSVCSANGSATVEDAGRAGTPRVHALIRAGLSDEKAVLASRCQWGLIRTIGAVQYMLETVLA